MPEQLAGFLFARGAEVLRAYLRFSFQRHINKGLQATVRECARRFLRDGERRRLLVALPPLAHRRYILPLSPAAENAVAFWHEALLLMDAVQQEFPSLVDKLRPLLSRAASIWEFSWNSALKKANYAEISPDEIKLINDTDRTWAALVQQHLDGFSMQAEMTARLL